MPGAAAGPGSTSGGTRRGGKPPLPVAPEPDLAVDAGGVAIDVVVVEVGGRGGAAGAAADAAREPGRRPSSTPATGDEVVGIYPGPTVIARTPTRMLHVDADEMVVATGAAEIQPVCPGNDLAGLVTASAARAADVGCRVAIGTSPTGP